MVAAREKAGKRLTDVLPGALGVAGLSELVLEAFEPEQAPKLAQRIDVVFMALPHAASARAGKALYAAGVHVVDCSADFRLKDAAVYEKTYAVEHPAHFRVMYGAEVDSEEGPLAEAKAEKLGMLIAGVEACQRAGVFPPGPPERLAVVAWSLVHGLATLWVDGVLQRTTLPSTDARGVAEMVTGSLLRVFEQGGYGRKV